VQHVGDKNFLTTLEEILDPSKAALVMYDPLDWILRDYASGDAIEATTPGLWDRWKRLLEGARQSGVTVIYTQHVYDWDKIGGSWLRYLAGTRTLEFLQAMPFVSGTTASPDPSIFIEALRPLPGEHIAVKAFHDSFSGTDFADLLRRLQVETIVLSGMATESGISGTARRAASEGFYAVVVGDCVSGSPDLHPVALDYLKTAVDVVTCDQVLAAWDAAGSAARGD
jgi:nicotinamidase-related amidase